MFQRTLILVAILAAFASGIPFPIQPCQNITFELQRAFHPEDPHTFHNISNFIYTRGNISINFNNFVNLIFKGFSHVYCNSFNYFGPQLVTTVNLAGQNLEFSSSLTKIQNSPLLGSFTSKLSNYTLELRFIDYFYSPPDLFNLCITNGTLEMIFHADGITTDIELAPEVAEELNHHPEAVVEAINLYLPRFANDLTTTLNKILCRIIPPQTTAIPNPTPENRGTFSVGRTGAPSTLVLFDRRPSATSPSPLSREVYFDYPEIDSRLWHPVEE
ncbi:uncharacterized protein [Palaemon carinicauda]|uniref:uncharacterized protein n=1 Tax=Palaemon carinicauda TaxID=392227 RepID=UPI0035B686FD